MESLSIAQKTLLLDGGLGRELRFRGVKVPETIWSAASLISDPDIVRQIHSDYIKAGADIITTNTYGVIRNDLAKEHIEERFEELNVLACKLAIEARDSSGSKTIITGSLPPLRGSFRPDLVGPIEEILPLYMEQANILAPYVDIFLCETMSSGAESYAAAKAACSIGKPVWVSWTLHEDRSGNLRSGETIDMAIQALAKLNVSGYLANCCAPEAITQFIPKLSGTGAYWIGGYANTFAAIPEGWTLDGKNETDGLLPLRTELGPDKYC